MGGPGSVGALRDLDSFQGADMSDLTRHATIYGLFDLNDLERRIVYVGQTTRRLSDRLNSHRSSCRKGVRFPVYADWMRRVDPANVGVLELEVCDYTDRLVREQSWIERLGTRLDQTGYNADDPLAGPRAAAYYNPPGSASRVAQANTLRATLATSAAKEKTSAATAANWQKPEYRAKLLVGVEKRASRGGQVGNHRRYHLARGVVSDHCKICRESAV